MRGGWCVGVDNADTRAWLKRGNEIVKQAVGLGDFVIHVHQNCNVERIGWQPWIVRLPKADHNVSQSEVAHATAQAPQILGYDIFSYDAAVGTHDRGQPYDVIAAARPNIRGGHPGFDAEQTHEVACFAGSVALLFVVPDWADNVGDWAIRIWKGGSRRTRFGQEFPGGNRYRERARKDGGKRASHDIANVMSPGLPVRS